MKLDNAVVKQILEAIADGAPIVPPASGYTIEFCMTIAAVMNLAAALPGKVPTHTNTSRDAAAVVPQYVMIAEQLERSAREALHAGRKGFKKR